MFIRKSIVAGYVVLILVLMGYIIFTSISCKPAVKKETRKENCLIYVTYTNGNKETFLVDGNGWNVQLLNDGCVYQGANILMCSVRKLVKN